MSAERGKEDPPEPDRLQRMNQGNTVISHIRTQARTPGGRGTLGLESHLQPDAPPLVRSRRRHRDGPERTGAVRCAPGTAPGQEALRLASFPAQGTGEASGVDAVRQSRSCPRTAIIVVTLRTTGMNTVGIRELKANLSRHMKRVRGGARLVVTERGRAIASIQPIQSDDSIEWVHAFVAAGRARWSGGKPHGATRPAPIAAERAVSDAVIEDR